MEDTSKEEKKPDTTGEEFKRIEVDFFQELPININVEGEDPFTVFMRPLKVKEIEILNRVTYLQERNPESEQAAMMLVNLVISTLNVSGDELPIEAAGGLVAEMIAYNFPKDVQEKSEEDIEREKIKAKFKKTKVMDGLLECFDFLITHGHSYADILEYPVPLFNNFMVVIAERLGIKKKPMDAAAAFRKLGLPIKPRNGSKKK